MDLQALKGFYWAGVHSSFSKAGAVLNIGQSAISHQVKALEDELQVKLYEREGRGIVLTPAGKILMAYVDIILQTLDNIETHFAELSRGNRYHCGLPGDYAVQTTSDRAKF